MDLIYSMVLLFLELVMQLLKFFFCVGMGFFFFLGYIIELLQEIFLDKFYIGSVVVELLLLENGIVCFYECYNVGSRVVIVFCVY